MGNDTYLSNSDVIKKLDDLSAAVGGTTVPTTTAKTNTDFVIGINKSIDAASGRTGVEYPPYSHNTLVTDKLDELAEAIAEGGGGGPGPTPVMGALNVTENGDYLPSSYNYDGFSSVSVDVSEPTPVTPEFTETVLWYTGSSEQTISLSDDYHNYDLVRFKFWNRSGQYSWEVVTTPSSLDKILSFEAGVCFNEFNNNQYWYGTYDDTTYTFTHVHDRNTYFSKVVGLVCNNFTMTEDVIYSAPSRSSDDVTISTDKNLYNYYALMVVANGAYDEIQPCYLSIDPHADEHLPKVQQIVSKFVDPVHLIAPFDIRSNYINPYKNSQAVTITDDGYGLSSARYAYVTGIKFT